MTTITKLALVRTEKKRKTALSVTAKRNIANALLSAFCLVVVNAFFAPVHCRAQEKRDETAASLAFIANGCYPLDRVMEAIGYRAVPNAPNSYDKKTAGPTIVLKFDFAAGRCHKNNYVFDLAGRWLEHEGRYYIQREFLEKVTNHDVRMLGIGVVQARPVRFGRHGWIDAFPALIAHAGGAYRMATGNRTYSNVVAAVEQNYDLGHRVFEIDFQITSDDNLAAVHDGVVPGDETGIFLSSREWLAFKGIGGLATALVGDILDQMLVNADMFLVTDTKWSGAEAFRILRREALARDPALLDRVIPQIYNRGMYDPVMEVHDFPSVIFTTYATRESPEDIVRFCANKENIRVITTPGHDGGVDETLARLAARNNLLIYAHTLNNYNDITVFRRNGVHGLYTDYLTPADFAVYDAVSRKK